jgi:carboxylate-amine ligase
VIKSPPEAGDLSFSPSPGHTVGVEVELQLLDSQGLMFLDAAPELLSSIPEVMKERIKEEFIKSMVEINTAICHDVCEVESDLRESLRVVEEGLRPLGAVVYAASLHPLEMGTGENVTHGQRYARIMDDLQIVGRRFITQGLHVHIGVEDPERAIKINNTVRMYLPMLLALTTSSPFYRGERTGMYSYRTKLFEALPLAGMPDDVDGWEGFRHMVQQLREGGIIETVRDLWWDVRPNTILGTVEVRVCDVPTRLRDIVAIAAFIQSLVSTIENVNMHPEARLNLQILRANKWQAARYGLDGVFINPVSARRSTMRQAVGELLDIVAPEARRLGSMERLEDIRVILERGTGAHRQLELYERNGDFRSMIEGVREDFIN